MTVLGLDVNYNQYGELVDPAATRVSGRDFIIFEATWGLQKSIIFDNWSRYLDVGFILLAYGFFRGDTDGSDQADFLLNTVAPMYEAQGFWMPLFADVERFNGDNATVAQRRFRIEEWIDTIRGATLPGVYSNANEWQLLTNNLQLDPDVIGWAAHWTASSDFIKPNWGAVTQFHQYGVARVHSWVPAIPGVSGDVSADRFLGSRAELLDLAVPIETPDPEPPPGGEPVDLQPVVDAIDRMTVQTKESFEDLYETLYDLFEGGGPTEPPPTPEPITIVRVIRDPHANAFFAADYNANNIPIMEIYPGNNEPVSERIQWDMGTLVAVDPEPVRADGGAYFWAIDPSEYASGLPQLYFHPSDVAEV